MNSHAQARARPLAAATTGKPGSGVYYTRHRHRSRRSRKIWKLQITTLLLGIALTLATGGWFIYVLKANAMEEDVYILAAQTNRMERELKQTREELSGKTKELDQLIKNRLPNLNDLVFDTNVAIESLYVKNIGFTLSGYGDEKHYEYHLVMQNNSLNTVNPNVQIILFDQLGIQAGSAKITKEYATAATDSNDLLPGETRAYSGVVPLSRRATPKYFLLEVL